jgi:hypothetical protein
MLSVMGYSIELYFDSGFEEKIYSLWETLSLAGLPSILSQIGSRPHVSLAVLNRCNEKQISDFLLKLVVSVSKFGLEFSALAHSPGEQQAVFLVTAGNKALFDLHKRLNSLLLDSGNPPVKDYQPDRWLPHCSLSKELSPGKALKTLGICRHRGLLGPAQVIGLGFIEFRSRREIQTHSFLAGARRAGS